VTSVAKLRSSQRLEERWSIWLVERNRKGLLRIL